MRSKANDRGPWLKGSINIEKIPVRSKANDRGWLKGTKILKHTNIVKIPVRSKANKAQRRLN